MFVSSAVTARNFETCPVNKTQGPCLPKGKIGTEVFIASIRGVPYRMETAHVCDEMSGFVTHSMINTGRQLANTVSDNVESLDARMSRMLGSVGESKFVTNEDGSLDLNADIPFIDDGFSDTSSISDFDIDDVDAQSLSPDTEEARPPTPMFALRKAGISEDLSLPPAPPNSPVSDIEDEVFVPSDFSKKELSGFHRRNGIKRPNIKF